jgi:hypothetical protein
MHFYFAELNYAVLCVFHGVIIKMRKLDVNLKRLQEFSSNIKLAKLA